jgi:transcriptional regulator with XRE-family HTH domain
MRPTADQKQAFAERLVALRRASRLTQAQVVEQLADHGGRPITPAAYSEYERQVSTPSLDNAVALARIFGESDGALAALLGYSIDGGDPVDVRLSRLEEQMAELLRLLPRGRKRGGRA